MIKETEFKPAWWLPNAHLQTLWPTLCRRPIKKLLLKRERFELPDGDFIDLDWADNNAGSPIVLVLHGLEGSIDSPYAKGILRTIQEHGWRGVFMHFRSCSGEPNRLPRLYHSGETTDVVAVMQELLRREPRTQFAAIGYSLGGNVLLKWLGETAENNPLTAAIAVCVPYEIQKTCKRIGRGFSRIYQWHMLKSLRRKLRKKLEIQPNSMKVPPHLKFNSLWDFDEKITVPAHGFSNITDYYKQSSSRQYLKKICVPTLLMHAQDDPFMTDDIVPGTHELSEHITLEVTKKGGHVGFVTGSVPWRAQYWLEKRLPAFLRNFL